MTSTNIISARPVAGPTAAVRTRRIRERVRELLGDPEAVFRPGQEAALQAVCGGRDTL
ncbi:MAG: hypothetical protein F2825_08855, partial [Actinobacteria bacterium]|nr:hypothetical protein [Actinomycetota bacterium]